MRIVPTLPAERAEPLWDELWTWVRAEFPKNDVSIPLAEWTSMYCQAILAHDAGAGEAAAMACRSAVESIGYTYLRLRPTAPCAWVARFPDEPGESLERLGFEGIQTRLRRMEVLTPELEIILNRIKFNGDAAAHISQRMEDEFKALTSGRPRRPGAPSDPQQLWMTQADVLRDLKGALKVFRSLIMAAKAERDRAAR